MLSSADSLTWFGAVTGQTPAALTALCSVTGCARPVIYTLPLGGATPQNDAQIRGCLSGISTATTQGGLMQAVLKRYV